MRSTLKIMMLYSLGTILVSFLSVSFAFIKSTNRFNQMTQWVKITTTHFNDFRYQIKVDNLESSVIDCGYNCSLVKLATTPFSDSGILQIRLRMRLNCGSRGSVDIHFSKSNGFLSTPTTNYHIPVEGTYCVFTSVDANVFGSPKEGYKINLIGN